MRDNIILCGFMGCGKTTVGRRLAKLTGRKLIDTDAFIVEREGMEITDIFAQKGEEYFRRCEYDVCREISAESCRVIATGGGTVLKEDNVKALKENGVIVYLKVSPETALLHLSKATNRPLLMRDDRDEYIRQLMLQRDPIYTAAANFIIDAEASPDYIALNIMKTVKIL